MSDIDIEKEFEKHINEMTRGRPHGVNRLDLHKLTFTAAARLYEAKVKERDEKITLLEKKCEVMREALGNKLAQQERIVKVLEKAVGFYGNSSDWDMDQFLPDDVEEISVMNMRIEYAAGKCARQAQKEVEKIRKG